VLWVLLVHADLDGGLAWPSRATIARHTGRSPRAVFDALQRLRAAGHVAVETESLGRRPTTYRILPTATPTSFLELVCRRPTVQSMDCTVGDPSTVQSMGCTVDALATVQSEAPTVQSEAPTVQSMDCHQTSEPENPSTPPTPPGRGGGEAAPAGRSTERRDQILEILREHRVVHANPFRARAIIDQTLEDGLTDPELLELLRLADDQGDQPAGLLWHWLGDVHRWRSVLDDARLAARERRARAAPSAIEVEPRRLAEVAGGPRDA
jgi:hypothetical protein